MKISVVIPTIGRQTTWRAIESVNDQTFGNLQVIVVDDSKDQNLNYPGVTVLRTGGEAGVSAARNLGISKSKGEWVSFLDDDDYWDSKHLENLISVAKDLKADFVISSANMAKQGIRRPKVVLNLNISPLELLYGQLHIGRSKAYLPTAGYLVKLDLAKTIKFDETLIDRENLDFVYRAYISGALIAQSPLATVNIDYSASNSIARATLRSELAWYENLLGINSTYARNFKIESSRNFLRRFELLNALRMLLL